MQTNVHGYWREGEGEGLHYDAQEEGEEGSKHNGWHTKMLNARTQDRESVIIISFFSLYKIFFGKKQAK